LSLFFRVIPCILCRSASKRAHLLRHFSRWIPNPSPLLLLESPDHGSCLQKPLSHFPFLTATPQTAHNLSLFPLNTAPLSEWGRRVLLLYLRYRRDRGPFFSISMRNDGCHLPGLSHSSSAQFTGGSNSNPDLRWLLSVLFTFFSEISLPLDVNTTRTSRFFAGVFELFRPSLFHLCFRVTYVISNQLAPCSSFFLLVSLPFRSSQIICGLGCPRDFLVAVGLGLLVST